MGMDEFSLYGGLAGARLPVESFDFGRGIIISRIYALLMAFTPAERGNPPGTVASGQGRLRVRDIHAQIHVPTDFKPSQVIEF